MKKSHDKILTEASRELGSINVENLPEFIKKLKKEIEQMEKILKKS